MKAFQHFKTITHHKILVMQGCFQVGLYKQGILHDLSKYSPSEFWVGAKYYQGTRSPNNAEREEKGYSEAWMHHKGRNKHHYEYWFDYSIKAEAGGMAPAPMPKKYIVEMFIDRVSASKTYEGKNYTCHSPLKYYENGNTSRYLHPYTRKLLERLLKMLDQKGEQYTYHYIRNRVLHIKK